MTRIWLYDSGGYVDVTQSIEFIEDSINQGYKDMFVFTSVTTGNDVIVNLKYVSEIEDIREDK